MCPQIEPLAVIKERSAVIKEPSAVVKEPSAMVKEPSAVVKEPLAIIKEPLAIKKEPLAATQNTSKNSYAHWHASWRALLLAACITSPIANAEAPPAAIEKIIPVLKSWGENPVLISAVKEQNSKNITLDQINKRDKEWMATTGLDDQMKAMMKNAAATELNKLEATKPYFFESILMDNQGANVAMTNKTSDYWQGDEDKFTHSFKGGAGGVDVGKSKFDDSAKVYLIQVSVPVVDAGKVIGALCVGINLDELDKNP